MSVLLKLRGVYGSGGLLGEVLDDSNGGEFLVTRAEDATESCLKVFEPREHKDGILVVVSSKVVVQVRLDLVLSVAT